MSTGGGQVRIANPDRVTPQATLPGKSCGIVPEGQLGMKGISACYTDTRLRCISF